MMRYPLIDLRRTTGLALLAVVGLFVTNTFAQQPPPLVPETVTLNEAAQQAIDAEWLTEDERRALRVFHGVWDDRDLGSPLNQAIVALNAGAFDHPSLSDERVPAELRAQAKLRAGELHEAIAIIEAESSNHAARIRAEAFDLLGDSEQAAAAIDPVVDELLSTKINDPQELTEAVNAMVLRARIEGQPARDFQTMMELYARAHQELDRLYWPAVLAEAELLIDKSNVEEAVRALHQVLRLNPRCAQAWYLLGQVSLRRFDFASAGLAANVLRRMNPAHPLAALLLAESRLTQDDPEGAQELLKPLLREWPKMRPALELLAASHALLYDNEAVASTLVEYERLSPGSPRAYATLGRFLALNRQYESAAAVLNEAIRRAPKWPQPQIELGLMELQSGRDARALDVLTSVSALDPFDKRAANSLFLIQQLTEYHTIESEHFIVRYEPGVDVVTAEMMPPVLERIHATVSARFNFEPDRKTVIELMPDHKRFSVRITGMPWIHTVAACTGPVIAMEVPREGPRQLHMGVFDWPRVVQHEYTHTITLAQTGNRIPHWLTEAAAVAMELSPRNYDTCVMLAEAYHDKTLFSLDEIKWGFIRPKRANDRAKAYAQSHWMVEFMNERFGESALLRLLSRYFEGEREQDAIPNALGISREQFFEEFVVWAGRQVEEWGLSPQPTIEQLTDAVRMADPDTAEAMRVSQEARLNVVVRRLASQIGEPASWQIEPLRADQWPPLMRPPVDITDELLDEWLAEYPDHPDLWEARIRRRLDEIGTPDEAIVPLLERYAELRPVDPFPHRQLALYWLESDTPQNAIGHLEELDIREEHTPVYAVRLAQLYRDAGDLDRALHKAERTLHINPYHAANRELAATIALQAGNLEKAHQHIRALTLIEPDRPRHLQRLQAIERMMAR